MLDWSADRFIGEVLRPFAERVGLIKRPAPKPEDLALWLNPHLLEDAE